MTPNIVTHDPNAIRSYGLSFAKVLLPGTTLSSVVWAVPTGLTKIAEMVNGAPVTDTDGKVYAAGTLAQVRISGGTAGTDYDCVAHIVASNGDEDDRTLRVLCRQQ